MKTGSLEGFVDRTWQVVHDSGELAAAVTSYAISGLDGDTDVKYRLISRVVNGYNGAVDFPLRPNNDLGNNYGYQVISANSTTAFAARGTTTGLSNAVGYSDALNSISFADLILNAKSGSVRTGISKTTYNVAGTTVGSIQLNGISWNNTADNITSLVIAASAASGIGIGSRFILLKEVHVPSGLRTGELDIRGTLEGAWQEIYRHTVTSSFDILSGSGEVEVLVVGGGSGGSGGAPDIPGSGGNGGQVVSQTGVAVTVGSYPIVVGIGGLYGAYASGYSGVGGDSSAFGYTATGGAAVHSSTSSTNGVGASGTGKDGITSDFSGASVMYGSGGGRSYVNGYEAGGDGAGSGSWGPSPAGGHAGLANRGGGGGGHGGSQITDNHGGSGIVIVRYLTSSGIVAEGGTVTADGLYTVHSFTGGETSITVTGFLGNTLDQLLRVRVRAVNGYNGNSSAYILLNSDAGNNYGDQYIQGASTTASAGGRTGQGTLSDFCGYTGLGMVSSSEILLYAKKGYPRTAIVESIHSSGAVVLIFGKVWQNTADELTGMVISSSQANGLGIGTEIIIERLNL